MDKPELCNLEEAIIAMALAEYISALRFGGADCVYDSVLQKAQTLRNPVKKYFMHRLEEVMAYAPQKAA